MILLCGIPSESPLAMVAKRLDHLGVPYRMFNQRHFAESELVYEIAGGNIRGHFRITQESHCLEEFVGVYTRLMDDQALPELRHHPMNSRLRQYCRSLHDTLIRWCEIAPIRVVNRAAPMGSNASKSYQAQLIRKAGFEIPETLITNDPESVIDFYGKHRKVIYKSLSGARSIVQQLREADLNRIERVRWCPTQFQVFVEGTNVRVHTIGSRVFATAIRSEATDYRYSVHQVDSGADLEAITIPDELSESCIRLSRSLDLPFAGIDLKITPDQRVYCFEVNPSPGFSYYESQTDQPIAEAVARYLAGLDD